MRRATAVAVLVAGIGCLLVLTAGARLVLYWALVVPSVLLMNYGLRIVAIATVIAVIVVFVNVLRNGRSHEHLRGPSRTAIAKEETT